MDTTTLHRTHEGFAAPLTEAAVADLRTPGDGGGTALDLYGEVMAALTRTAAHLGPPTPDGAPHPRKAPTSEADGEHLAREFRQAARMVEHAFARARDDSAKDQLAEHTELVRDATRRLARILALD